MIRLAKSALAAGGLAAVLANAAVDEPKVVKARVVKVDGEAHDDDKRAITVVVDDDKEGELGKKIVRRIGNFKSPAGAKETYLGVVTETVPAVLAAQMPKLLSKDQGLVVAKALENSPAAKAGLRANDVIATMGDQKIFNSEQLKKLVCAEKVGATVELGVVREGKLMQLSATLAERPVSAFAWTFDGKDPGGDFQWKTGDAKEGQRRVEVIRKQALDQARTAASEARAQAGAVREHALLLEKELAAKARHEAHKARDAAHQAEDAAREAHKKAIAIYRKATEEKAGKPKAGASNKRIALSITVGSDATPKVAVEFTDENGNDVTKKFEGKLEDLESQLKDLPSDISAKVRDALKGIHMDGKGSISISSGDKAKSADKPKAGAKTESKKTVKILGNADMIKTDDGKGAFRFRIGRPDGSATFKAIDFDVDLDLKDIMKQLGDLGPEVKAEVEKALKSVKVPKIDASVEKSQ